MIGQIIYVGIALILVGRGYPQMLTNNQATKLDMTQVPSNLADAATKKMRVSLWFNGLCTLLGEALIWPVTLAFVAWMRIGAEVGATGGSIAPAVVWDPSVQRLVEGMPDPDEQVRQQKVVLQALAPVLENDLSGVHLALVAFQLIGVARYKIKMLFVHQGDFADLDAQTAKSVRAMADVVARAPTDDAATADYLEMAVRAVKTQSDREPGDINQ